MALQHALRCIKHMAGCSILQSAFAGRAFTECRSVAVAGKSGQPVASRYDLLANVVHDGKAGEGSYRCHIHRKVDDWHTSVQIAPSSHVKQILLLQLQYCHQTDDALVQHEMRCCRSRRIGTRCRTCE